MPTPQTGTGPGFDKPLPAGGADLRLTPAGGTVPNFGAGSATELRNQQTKVQADLDELQRKISAGEGSMATAGVASPSENTLIGQYTARLASLAQQIQTTETRAPTVIGGNSPSDKYLIQANPDGTIITDPATGKPPENPNWDHKTERPQSITSGNHILNVANDGTVTVAYTDDDAQKLAAAQTAVAENNSKVAAAAQATNDFATRARVEMEQRVANGEDAASVRADLAQKLTEAHNTWVEADGDAQRAQTELRDYNTERHQTAQDTLAQDVLDNTRKWQQMQDQTSRRGQDVTAQTSAASTREGLANQRLSSGASYMGNTLSTLAQLNKDAPPGSGAVGDMLVPLMNLGQSFFSQLGGLASPDDVVGALGQYGGGQPAPTTPDTTPAATTPDQVGGAAPVTAGLTPSTPAPTSYADLVAKAGIDQTPQNPVYPGLAQGAQKPQAPIYGGLNQGTGPYAPNPYGLPAFAQGGVVTKPTVALVGEKGPEAIVPLNKAPATQPMGGLSQMQSFFARLGAGVLAAHHNAGQQAALATQGAAAMGHPAAAAANPVMPGSAVPGVPPQAAAAQARAMPMSPDGSAYIGPQAVQAMIAQRRAARGMV